MQVYKRNHVLFIGNTRRFLNIFFKIYNYGYRNFISIIYNKTYIYIYIYIYIFNIIIKEFF